jgi:hypothetical protein
MTSAGIGTPHAGVRGAGTAGARRRLADARVVVPVLVAVAAGLRLHSFGGLVGADDVSLAKYAFDLLANGLVPPETHYQARIGIVAPLAGLFALFGPGEAQLAALPLLSSLAAIPLAYAIATRLVDRYSGLLAAAALAVFPLDVYYATRLYPDVILGTLLALTVYAALRARDPAEARPMVWAVLGGLVWGWAYLVKVEAAFLLPALAFVLLPERRAWPAALALAAACAVIVVGESVVYRALGGEVLHRLQVLAGMGGGQANEAYSMTQLWVFPKAWFATPYFFGLHYYALVAAAIWALVTRRGALGVIGVWLAVMLLWLQFGGNPFAEDYSVKSHLQRYCLIVAVPTAVMVGAAAAALWRHAPRMGAIAVAAVGAVSLFLINFNVLAGERQMAAKTVVRTAFEQGWSPLYMDRGTYDIAAFLKRASGTDAKLIAMQRHDFDTGRTRTIQPGEAEGYVALTPGFMSYRRARYDMDRIPVDRLRRTREVALRVDNPANTLSYAQARLLGTAARALAAIIPVADGAARTAAELVAGGDAVVFVPPGRTGGGTQPRADKPEDQR